MKNQKLNWEKSTGIGAYSEPIKGQYRCEQKTTYARRLELNTDSLKNRGANGEYPMNKGLRKAFIRRAIGTHICPNLP